MTKTAALFLENTAHIFDVSHIVEGDYFEDDAIQYMAERLGVTGVVDGWHFADSLQEMRDYCADRRIAIAN